ncbi:MAG: S8 family serine peptidase, partial [Thermoplasmata archaeon]|nr:S8 family serine peptidase [Thermoplasmata archaeon]
MDTWSRQNKDALHFCAAGNEGPGAGTIIQPANGKNDVTIGASGNDRPSYKFVSNPNVMVDYSSRGPGQPSGRIEPDITSISGVINSVHATNYDEDPAEPGYNNPFDPDDTRVDVWTVNDLDPPQYDYSGFGGTSAATSFAAGNCALLRQYFVEMETITPSGALMKGCLINGAVDMGYGYPSFDQGWGRLNVKNSIFPDGPRTWQYYDSYESGTDAGSFTVTGNSWNSLVEGVGIVDLNVQSDRVPLKATLVWTDNSGNFGDVTSDLHLTVTSPGGTEYRGNQFTDSWSTPNPVSYDTTNTVENVFIQFSEEGEYEINITSINIDTTDGYGGINWALVVSGDFGPEEDYKVELSALSPQELRCVANGSVNFNFNLLNFGTNQDSIILSEVGLPAGFTVNYEPPGPIDLVSNMDMNIAAIIMVGPAVTPGAYEFDIKATSTGDLVPPIAQDKLHIIVDIIPYALPRLIRATDDTLVEDSPTILTYNNGTADWLWITFRKHDANGPHVYAKYSNDMGQTWSSEMQVSTASDGPSDPRIIRNPFTERIHVLYHGSTASTTLARASYSDPPYVSWSAPIQIWSTSDSIRRCDMKVFGTSAADDEIVVCMEYIPAGATNIRWARSTNDGTSWLASALLIGNAAPDFFPELGRAQNGNVWISWHISENPRNIHYRIYTGGGTWGAEQNLPPLQNGQQDVFPALWSTDEGAGSDRMYVSAMYSFQTTVPDPPFTMELAYTDDGGSSWSSRRGLWATNISQAGYPTGRPLQQIRYTTDGFMWNAYGEEDPLYGTVNLETTYSDTQFPGPYDTYRVTADAYGHGHQTIDALGDTIYEAFDASYAEGNQDIWIAVYNMIDVAVQNDPDSVPDTTGPEARSLTVTPDPAPGSTVLRATIDDS